MKTTLKKLTPLLVVFAVLGSSHFIDAAWIAPSGQPSATNNAPAPINVSNVNQLKLGDITALNVKAGSQMWSAAYCDENGENCSTSGGGLPICTEGDMLVADATGGWVCSAGASTQTLTYNTYIEVLDAFNAAIVEQGITVSGNEIAPAEAVANTHANSANEFCRLVFNNIMAEAVRFDARGAQGLLPGADCWLCNGEAARDARLYKWNNTNTVWTNRNTSAGNLDDTALIDSITCSVTN